MKKCTLSEKLVRLLHFTRACLSKILIIITALALGTALLSVYSFINVVNRMARIYKGSPAASLAVLLVLIILPTGSYLLEKRLNAHLQRK